MVTPGRISRLVESRRIKFLSLKPGTPLWRHCPITIVIRKNLFGVISKILDVIWCKFCLRILLQESFLLLFQLLVAINPKDI